jgi:hypothetical protein
MIAALREQLGDDAFMGAWAEGAALSPEQAEEYALGDVG